ncbi:winged helix-turn-helix transcriptional regulator [Actinacidiphila sp. ITFR-21]|uniref:winged helix-turn-helix transcriptional regulator n=1 Tax=Actinacidiphila sp. ITFR-21 TaxID=3075199 RepID=UPI00288A9293|nr:helix-turn-helix domain-containing protein [Streptomyces sp. ITFR-21]WNI16698.1 helix-turn-helix domain-containing protein [Streptomyces sp. ITFR-21]
MERGQQLPARVPCTGVDVALTRVFELFGKRWTGLIVAVLTQRAAYFAELRRAIPRISERMLSDRLTELADAGLVVREVDPGPPLRVSYGLTEAGLAIRPALHELGQWAQTYLPENSPCVGTAAEDVLIAAEVLGSGACGGDENVGC